MLATVVARPMATVIKAVAIVAGAIIAVVIVVSWILASADYDENEDP